MTRQKQKEGLPRYQKIEIHRPPGFIFLSGVAALSARISRTWR
jgi:hypothetical protein